ncbi:phosphatidylserine decarboxylase [bacterium]|nr:phosphatidylserine decarboxylase [bacterium]
MLITPKLCRSLTQETYRFREARHILIIGSHPMIIKRLLKRLREEDTLMICEPHNDSFIKLRRKLAKRRLKHKNVRVKLYNLHPWELEQRPQFNSIIITQDLSKLNDSSITHIIESCQKLLVPGGCLSCCEVAFSRRIRRFSLANGRFIRSQRNVDALDHYVDSFQNYKETVWNAVFPIWVHNLQFTPQRSSMASSLMPSEERYSFNIGKLKVSKDVLKFAPWLLAATGLLKKLKASFWYLPLIILSGVLAFLRDPKRSVHAEPDEVLSACDGEVMDVSTVSEPCMGPTPWLRISAFLSITNVHINRSPVAGKVLEQFEVEGKHVIANKYRAVHNHSCYTVIETDYGQVVVAQRVGLLARRIFNWVGRGELVAQGERYGLIRLGSRTDIYLPLERYSVLVKPGDKIKAGRTVVAKRLYTPEQLAANAQQRQAEIDAVLETTPITSDSEEGDRHHMVMRETEDR